MKEKKQQREKQKKAKTISSFFSNSTKRRKEKKLYFIVSNTIKNYTSIPRNFPLYFPSKTEEIFDGYFLCYSKPKPMGFFVRFFDNYFGVLVQKHSQKKDRIRIFNPFRKVDLEEKRRFDKKVI